MKRSTVYLRRSRRRSFGSESIETRRVSLDNSISPALRSNAIARRVAVWSAWDDPEGKIGIGWLAGAAAARSWRRSCLPSLVDRKSETARSVALHQAQLDAWSSTGH
jgi:hypothetical protein